MLVFKFMHILSMFAAVTLLVGGSITFELVARRRDPRTIRQIGAVLKSINNIGVVLLLPAA